MAVTLGAKPLTVNVNLPRNGNFTTTLRSTSDYPNDVGIELRFHKKLTLTDIPVIWEASISEDQATWNMTVAQVNAVIAMNPTVVRLVYKQGGADLIWGSGEINVL